MEDDDAILEDSITLWVELLKKSIDESLQGLFMSSIVLFNNLIITSKKRHYTNWGIDASVPSHFNNSLWFGCIDLFISYNNQSTVHATVSTILNSDICHVEIDYTVFAYRGTNC